ncbi:MAG: AraC family transcriptional regulator [Candidatus Pelagadaptatus aseana]
MSGAFTLILKEWLDKQAINDVSLVNDLVQASRRDSLPVEEWKALLARAEVYSNEPHFGLEIGGRATLANVGVLGYLVLNCETPAEALQTYSRCEQRFYGVRFSQLKLADGCYTLSWPDRLGDANGLFVRVALATLVCFSRQRFPTRINLLKVALTESRPENVAPFEAFFGCPVEFGSENPGISIDYQQACQTEQGDLPSGLRSMQIQQAQAFSEVVADRTPFLQQLQEVLLRLIPRASATIDEVARAMSMSPRTLQRRLAQFNLSYQLLLDGLRENLGARYLQQQGLSLVEIALLLGYSEQSTFNRAFKQWTGLPPGQYRRQLMDR